MEPVSQHDSVKNLYELLKKEGLTNCATRFEEQEKIRCKQFCEKGLSCQLCSNGPCRIVPGKVERGVCGIDGAGMVMRNLLHKENMGISNYSIHAKLAARTLKATAEGKTPFELKDVSKLDLLAQALGVKASDSKEKAKSVAQTILSSLNQDSSEESLMVETFAPPARKKVWRELGIFPGGPFHEIADSVARSMTNIDGDYVSLAKTGLRLGIASCFGAQVPLELTQDVLFGTPYPHEAEVDLGILDPDYVNILPNGHYPFLGAALIKVAHEAEVQRRAREAGAKGLRVIGSIETGQELMQRFPSDEVFLGMPGNWLCIEPTLATGAVDVFAMDNSCSPPAIGSIAQKHNSTLVATSHLIGVPGVDKHLDYRPEKVEAQAKEIVNLALENFKKRKGQPAQRGLRKAKILTGFSTEAVLKALGGSLAPLLDVIKKGDIKGVVALVSCTSLRSSGQDITTVAMAKELIKRDILLLTAGCGNGGCQVGGLNSLDAQDWAGGRLKAVCKALGIPPALSFGTCTDVGRLALLVIAVADALGVDIPQLPIAVTAPEYMEQKATIDAFSAVALGLYTHVAPTPPVTGSPEVVKLLTQDVEGLVGGKLAVGEDPKQAADGIEAHILAKRKALGI